jgi:hypothetical protein
VFRFVASRSSSAVRRVARVGLAVQVDFSVRREARRVLAIVLAARIPRVSSRAVDAPWVASAWRLREPRLTSRQDVPRLPVVLVSVTCHADKKKAQ